MQRMSSPFQGASRYTAHASGPVNNPQEMQHYGVHTEHDGRFLPPGKLHDNTGPPCSVPLPDSLMHGQPPSRGASPSPASTLQSQTTSLFSTHSPASSIYMHPSSSRVSVCSGRESPAPSSFSHYPNSRPLSPPGRINSPCARPPSRSNARPGSPLSRHKASLNGSRAYCNNFAGVARSASRRSNRLGSFGAEHSAQQLMRQMDSGNMRPGAKQNSSLEDQDTSFLDEPMTGVGYSGHAGATVPPCSEAPDRFDAASQVSSEGHNFAPSPSSQNSQDATTMTGLSDFDETSPRSTNSDECARERTIRVLRTILGEEFDIRLGTSEPPQEMVSAVSDCLDKLSISRRQCHLQGHLVPANSIPVSADTPETTPPPSGGTESGGRRSVGAKKRGVYDLGRVGRDGVQDDDGDDDGGGACLGPNEQGNRKKAKGELYPCPFRKRNPIRFNIREWEYCSRAPFKSITELKRHIIKYHQQHQFSYQCDRCHASFASHEEKKIHLRRDPDKMCGTRSDREGSPSVPQDETVSSIVGERLRSRAEHFDWNTIWSALFPDDNPDNIPTPEFEPVVELHEVSQEYKHCLPKLTDMLLAVFGSHAEELTRTTLGIFEEFIGGVFQGAQLQAIAGAHGLLNPIDRQSRPLSQAPSPFPQINSGTPSSNTTNSSAARRIWSRMSGRSTGETSGASTPSSLFRSSPSLTTHTASPSTRSYRASSSGHHPTQALQSDYFQTVSSSTSDNSVAPDPMASSYHLALPQLQFTNRNPSHFQDQHTPHFLQRQSQQQNHYQQAVGGGHQAPPGNFNTHSNFGFGNSTNSYPVPQENFHSQRDFANGSPADLPPGFRHQHTGSWALPPAQGDANRSWVPESQNNFAHKSNRVYLYNNLTSLPDPPLMGAATMPQSIDELLETGGYGHAPSE